MCTLTWGYSNEGYHLHFNRDESRQRAAASPPGLQFQNGTGFLAPVDQQAMGTWILSNEYGLSVCLLNNYVDITPLDGERSRGLLVRDLSCAKNANEAISRIETENMSRYSPFDAFLFDLTGAREACWDGSQLTINPDPKPFKSSSGFDARNVIAERLGQFRETKHDPDSLRQFHRSHLPQKSAYSVCMHRDDARTQSYTEIILTRQKVCMSYIDGPPCSGAAVSDLILPLKQL